MASNDVDYAGGRRKKQESGSRCQRICKIIYNKDKGEILGRNCSSWAKIGTFYFIYYACLAGFFAIMLMGLFSTLDNTKPSMTGIVSLIKSNPGMGFRPQPDNTRALIHFNSSDNSTYQAYIDNILHYLKEENYITDDYQPSDITTDSNGKPVFNIGSADEACKIDSSNIYNSFGYAEGTPCVMLKINRVYGWEPEAFGNDSMAGENLDQDPMKVLGERFSTDNIGITCDGESDGDADSLEQVDYYPPLGFSFSYFPYLNAKDYRAPIVFVKFSKVRKGSLIQIWCKMWAKNIKLHKNDKAGSARFELLVDY